MDQDVTGQYVSEDAKKTPILFDVDVAIAGGGVAGLGAAVGAARNGARVVITEQTNCLGGAATATMMSVLHLEYSALHGFAKEVIDRVSSMGNAAKSVVVPYDAEAFKIAALELVHEAGANVLLYTTAVAPLIKQNEVRGVIIESKSGRQAILARVTIDCTGDGDIAWRAGAELVDGIGAANKKRPMTVLFRVGGIRMNNLEEYVKTHSEEFSPNLLYSQFDRSADYVKIAGFWSIIAAAQEAGEIDKRIHYLRFEGGVGAFSRGVLTVNSTRAYDMNPTDVRDLTRAEVECRRQMLQILGVMQKYMPGCESAYIVNTSEYIGIRDSRFIRGDYVLQGDDIREDRRWEDNIVRVYTHLAPGTMTHSPEGGEGSADNKYYREQVAPLRSYSIPIRCLIPKGLKNILVAGRCISVTSEAFESTRGQATCMNLGYAAGVAASLAVRQRASLRSIDVRELQRLLEEQGVETGARAKV